MASVGTVSIFQEARDIIERDISSLILCLVGKRSSLFIQIAELEDEFRGKQEQKLCSLGELQSLKARTEEKLGDNLLSDIQERVTRELQTGINKISLEARSLSVDYSIQMDWGNRVGAIKERIEEFVIKVVPNSVSNASRPKTAPSKKAKKKTNPYRGGNYNQPRSLDIEADMREIEWGSERQFIEDTFDFEIWDMRN